jgi:hypothetical protein
MRYIYLFVISVAALFVGSNCGNKTDGLFGQSKTKAEAIKNGLNVFLYLPDKSKFRLLDSTTLLIDTAWTEVSFSYNSGVRDLDSSYGYQFSIPVDKDHLDRFTFTFGLLDTTNRMFTNPGPEQDGFCRLRPKKLYNEIKVILKQKDTDTTKGWLNPIITDTITFKRLI